MSDFANNPNPLHVDPPPLRVLPGSDKGPAPKMATAAVDLSGEEPVHATLVLRRRADVPSGAFDASLDRAALSARYGASDDDIALVTSTLEGLGVQITATDPASRRLRISGTVALLSALFGTRLQQVTSMGPNNRTVTHRHRTGSLSVPAALDGVVTAVLGLDDRPQSRPQYFVAPAAAATTSYTPLDLGTIYHFPPGTDGGGQTIAIVELGGGFGQADLDAYFSGLGITGPNVTAVGVDGATNVPGQDAQGADGEVLLDIEVAGALAAKAALLIYFAPNTDAGFVDAVSEAAHASPTPAAISISWGQSEDDWTAQASTAFDQALVDAALLGVSVTVAAGDNGSTDRGTDGKDHADFPATSPHALACGGTRLMANTSTGAVSSENVWNDSPTSSATGGGVSDTFALPPWQQHITVKAGRKPKATPHGRGIPDVAAVADPQTGYRVRVDGADMVFGGTSAVAPLWAALLARCAQATGHGLGLVQPLLYNNTLPGHTPAGFRDITKGSNGTYHATTGWDACTGLGVPNGTELLGVFSAAHGSGPH